MFDGGADAVDLQLTALAGANYVRLQTRLEEASDDLDVLVSLGTGEQTRPLPYEQVKDWGRLEWARPVLDVVFDGTADAVDFQLESLLGAGYVRLQTPLDEASDELDDVSPENLEALEREAQRLIAARDDELDRLCAQLT